MGIKYTFKSAGKYEVELMEDELIIRNQGVLSKNEEIIKYKDIEVINFKENGMTQGYIRFARKGEKLETNTFKALQSKNAVAFSNADEEKRIKEIKEYVEKKIKLTDVEDVKEKQCISDLSSNKIYDFKSALKCSIEIKNNLLIIEYKSIVDKLAGHSVKKTIKLENITSIQIKEVGKVYSGYIRFIIAGLPEKEIDIFNMTQDENAIIFRNKREENYAKEIKRYIENYKHSINLSNEVAIDDGIAKKIGRAHV